MQAFYFAWKSYSRRGWGILLLVLPCSILFGLITLLVVAEQGFSVKLDQDDARYLRAGSPLGHPNLYFTQSECQRMAKLPHVEGIGVNLPDVGETVENGPHVPAQMEAPNSNYLRFWRNNHNIAPGVLEAWDAVKNGALVTKGLANRKGWKIGDPIEVPAANGKVAHLVVTGFDDTGREVIHVHPEYTITALGMAATSWVVWMQVDDARNNDEVQQAVNEMLPGRPIEFYTMVDSKAIIRGNRDVLLMFAFRLAGYLSAALLVAISLMLLSLTVEARAVELAALRVLGFRRWRVAMIIVIESVFNMVPGAILAGLAIFFAFHDVGIPFTGLFHPVVTWTPVLLTWAAALVMSIVGALPPAVPLLTLDVLGTLRGG